MTTQQTADRRMTGFAGWLPHSIDKRIRVLAWASLISQAALVVTGAAVRLTGSGLGCPTWPRCTADSLTNTPDMGIHGVIEFGNRTLNFILVAIALALLVSLWNLRRERRDLWWLSLSLLAVIPLQAIIGGLTVLTHLNPWVVNVHFLVSAALVSAATLLVRRTKDAGGRSTLGVSPALGKLGWAVVALAAVTIYLGTVVTGAGPHAGARDAVRNGIDPLVATWMHAIPVGLLLIVTIAALLTSRHEDKKFAASAGDSALGGLSETTVALTVVLMAELGQGIIGVVQAYMAVPVSLVAIHVFGSTVILAAVAAAWDAMRSRPPLPEVR